VFLGLVEREAPGAERPSTSGVPVEAGSLHA
jgi:hypothetical protein